MFPAVSVPPGHGDIVHAICMCSLVDVLYILDGVLSARKEAEGVDLLRDTVPVRKYFIFDILNAVNVPSIADNQMSYLKRHGMWRMLLPFCHFRVVVDEAEEMMLKLMIVVRIVVLCKAPRLARPLLRCICDVFFPFKTAWLVHLDSKRAREHLQVATSALERRRCQIDASVEFLSEVFRVVKAILRHQNLSGEAGFAERRRGVCVLIGKCLSTRAMDFHLPTVRDTCALCCAPASLSRILQLMELALHYWGTCLLCFLIALTRAGMRALAQDGGTCVLLLHGA